MPSGRRHFQGELRVLLALDVLEVDGECGGAVGQHILRQRHVTGRDRGIAPEVRNELGEGTGGEHVDAGNQRGLPGVDLRHDDAPKPLLAGKVDHREDAVGVPQRAVEGQLAEEDGVGEVGGHLAGAQQHAHGNGKIVGGAFLLEVCGGEVHGDPAHGEVAAAVAHSGPDAFTGFLDGLVAKADDRYGGQPW